MPPRALILIFVCLLLHDAPCSAASTAAVTAEMTVKLDGKALYLPELKVNQRITQVTTLLFIGAWRSPARARAKGNLAPLCALDLENNNILIKSPDKLLENSRTRVITRENLNHFLDSIAWEKGQSIHYALNVISNRTQPAVVELYTDSDAALYNNGKLAGSVTAASAGGAGGRGYIPVMLNRGANVIVVKQFSRGEPRIQLSVCLDHSHDLEAAWQTNRGFLKSLVCMAPGRDDAPELRWNPDLGNNINLSLEVRDVSTNDIVLRRESARRGKLLGDGGQNLARGIYEITYRVGAETNSEFFIVGEPRDLFAELQDKLAGHNPDSESKLNIEAHLRLARNFLSKEKYDISDRGWQSKAAYSFGCLADFERKLKAGAVNMAKDQPGLHIRGFASAIDGSFQSYRLFVPVKYNPDVPIPLLVIVSTGVANAKRPFLEGPAMANQQQARLWARYAEQNGFALLWSGYRGAPGGYTFESRHIDEAIKAVENDYRVDKHRISVHATCGAGYNAGRLVTEYDNRFAAIVYDRAVFDLSLDKIKTSPSLMEWYTTVNPSRHVINNKNLKIFVLHDDTKPAGHGPMELTTKFLEQAAKTRDDVVSYLAKQPMTQASRLEQVFTWLASCRNENPNDKRSYFLAKAGYTGPIMEIFATPVIIVAASHAQDNRGQESAQSVAESLANDYKKYFHGAECVIKIDDDVTPDDIQNNSLILIGNPQSNSVWEKLQSQLPVKMTSTEVMHEDVRLTGSQPFQAIARHPAAKDKYVLMIGAGDLGTLGQVTTENLFTAWYDAITATPYKIIGKLDSLHTTTK